VRKYSIKIFLTFFVIFTLSIVVFTSEPHHEVYSQLQNGQSNNCVNRTAIKVNNYLTLTCKNRLVKTNDIITNLSCATSTGWFVVCVWQQNPANKTSPSQISIASSQNGGQSFNKPLLNFANSSLSAKNPKVGMALEFAYVVWEQQVNANNSDVFLASSSDGGLNFGDITNISNSTTNSVNSTLIVDPDTGKYFIAWIEQGDDSVGSYCGRC
jgi:hypothetical protein